MQIGVRLWGQSGGRRYVIMLAALTVTTNCSSITDGAVDLARCIGEGARRMSNGPNATSEVSCAVRDNRVVTAILSPASSLNDAQIASLRKMNVPADAIYYSGPDSPSVGHRLRFAPVNVYDPQYADNRKYSASTALGSNVLIKRVMAKTANHFTVILQRRSDGEAEVIEFR